MDMQKFSRQNDGVKYLAIFIDLFSRYLRIEPMKRKTGDEMIKAMKKVFTKDNAPRTLRTDQGSEYKAKQVQELLSSLGIHHIITYNVYHANYAERAIRTVKGRLFRYFTHHQTHRYIDSLESLVHSYNDTIHSSIRMPPSKVTPENQQELYEKIYLPIELKRENTPVYYKFKIGDKVRVSYARRPFDTGYDKKWSEELFLIHKQVRSHPPRYRLIDLQREEIKGSFYEQELQMAHVGDDDLYKVERVLRYRIKGGKRQGLVSWLGYPAKFNSWVDADEIKNYE